MPIRPPDDTTAGARAQAAGATFHATLEGRLLACADAFAHLTGATPHALRDADLRALVIPEHVPQVEESLARVRTGAEIDWTPVTAVHRDGRTVPVEFFAAPEYDGPQVVGVRGIVRDLSRQAALERELRASERRFREMLEHVSLLAVILDQEGTVVYCNDFFLERTGWRRGQVLGQPWFDTFLPEERREHHRRHFLDALTSGWIAPHTEHEILTRDGGRRLIAWNNTILHDVDGRMSGATSIGEDVTLRRCAEDARRASEENLRTIFNNAHDAVFIHTETGDIVDVNDQMLHTYGVTREEALHFIGVRDYSAPETPFETLLEHWQAVMRGETRVFEWKGRRPHDGSTLDVEVLLRPIVLSGRQLILANVRDITVQKEGQRQARLARRVLENTLEGVLIVDAGGRIEFVNRAFTEITGYTPEDAVGQTPRLLRSDRHPPAFYKDLWQALLLEGRWEGEIWNRRKNGEAYPQWMTIAAVEDDEGTTTHYVGVFNDITESKRREERITHQAYHDALTGLPNRHLFNDRLQIALAHAERHAGMLAVMYLDLDHFKAVNDTHGHLMGDRLLQAVAARLRVCLRREDTISRIGGDEFTILITEVENREDAAEVARKLLAAFAEPVCLDRHTFHVTCSIGVSLYPADGNDAETLIRCADTALYRVKANGRGHVRFYEAE